MDWLDPRQSEPRRSSSTSCRNTFFRVGFPTIPGVIPRRTPVSRWREAIADKLVELGHIPPEMRDNWLENPESEDAKQLDEIISQIIRRMIDEGWLRSENPENAPNEGGEGYEDSPASSARFELTSKSVDFLGFRQLRHLLGSIGRSSLGRHETAQLSTGVEAYQESKEYEFGDTLNLDIAATLTRSIAREGLT